MSSFPRMLLHTYTEPQWLLPPNSESSSLDRLEAAETAHWDAVRAAVLPEPAAPPLGMAADETKTFGLMQAATSDGTAVAVGIPPAMTLQQYCAKYATATSTTNTSSSSHHHVAEAAAKGRPSDVSMDMSILSSASSTLSFASPTSRTG